QSLERTLAASLLPFSTCFCSVLLDKTTSSLLFLRCNDIIHKAQMKRNYLAYTGLLWLFADSHSELEVRGRDLVHCHQATGNFSRWKLGFICWHTERLLIL
ncbi:hypothetical protein AMECASPLE_022424, partial [Ameca splendens]